MKATHEPPLRFSRAKPWSLFRLKELGEFKSGVGFSENQQGGKEGTPFFKVSDMNLAGNEHVMLTANHYVTADQIKKNGYRPIGTSAILFAKVGAAIFHERKRIAQDFLMDNNMMAFLPSDLPIDFAKHLFDRVRLSKYAQVGALPSYNASDIGALKVHIPTLPEQRKIADFLTAVDGRIGQLSQKKALLEDYKKGVMQQLFTQALRFKDDQGNDFPAWEKKKLGAVCSILKGKGLSKADLVEDGATPCIRYGELYTIYSELIQEPKSRTNVAEKELVLSEENDVIIPASGETHIDIATASCVMSKGIALGGDLNIIRTKLNGVFLAYYLNNACKHAIARVAQGSSVIHLYPDQLKGLSLRFPSTAEQTKIANFLTALDRKIESVSSQIAHTQTFKKGLLQQMFV